MISQGSISFRSLFVVDRLYESLRYCFYTVFYIIVSYNRYFCLRSIFYFIPRSCYFASNVVFYSCHFFYDLTSFIMIFCTGLE